MSIIVCRSGELAFLDFLTGNGGLALNLAKAHLFTNNYVPVHTTTLADLLEATWAGYASSTLNLWSTATLDLSGHSQSTAGQVAFSNSSLIDQNAFGYYVTAGAVPVLLFAERFSSAPQVVPAGKTVGLLVTFTLLPEA